ncbi:hypothetical protein ABTM82_18950, partial [Acinetobacter baumannii]
MVERAVLLADNGEAIDIRHLFLGSDRARIRAGLTLTDDGRVAGDETRPEQSQAISQLVDMLRQNGTGLKTVEGAIVRVALKAARGNV